MSNSNNQLPEIPHQLWETLRSCRFVHRMFEIGPSLKTVKPVMHGGKAYFSSAKYSGEDFDPAIFEVVQGGWDHEHCNVCWTKIQAGDEYWDNDGPGEVCLCAACWGRLRDELTIRPKEK
jgi:hypothetical protein